MRTSTSRASSYLTRPKLRSRSLRSEGNDLYILPASRSHTGRLDATEACPYARTLAQVKLFALGVNGTMKDTVGVEPFRRETSYFK